MNLNTEISTDTNEQQIAKVSIFPFMMSTIGVIIMNIVCFILSIFDNVMLCSIAATIYAGVIALIMIKNKQRKKANGFIVLTYSMLFIYFFIFLQVENVIVFSLTTFISSIFLNYINLRYETVSATIANIFASFSSFAVIAISINAYDTLWFADAILFIVIIALMFKRYSTKQQTHILWNILCNIMCFSMTMHALYEYQMLSILLMALICVFLGIKLKIQYMFGFLVTIIGAVLFDYTDSGVVLIIMALIVITQGIVCIVKRKRKISTEIDETIELKKQEKRQGRKMLIKSIVQVVVCTAIVIVGLVLLVSEWIIDEESILIPITLIAYVTILFVSGYAKGYRWICVFSSFCMGLIAILGELASFSENRLYAYIVMSAFIFASLSLIVWVTVAAINNINARKSIEVQNTTNDLHDDKNLSEVRLSNTEEVL